MDLNQTLGLFCSKHFAVRFFLHSWAMTAHDDLLLALWAHLDLNATEKYSVLLPAWFCQIQECEMEPSCSSAQLTCQSTKSAPYTCKAEVKQSTPKPWQITVLPPSWIQMNFGKVLWNLLLPPAELLLEMQGFMLELSMPEEQLYPCLGWNVAEYKWCWWKHWVKLT